MKRNSSSCRTVRGNEICEKEVNSGQLESYPDVMTVAQVMRVLGICRHAAYALVNSGKLGSLRIGKRTIVPKVCVQDYLNSARVGQSATAGFCQKGAANDR